MKERWIVLIGYCSVVFSNALGFGIFTTNLEIYADQYNTTPAAMQNSFYIGLLVEILFCIPAIKIIEWRFDYAVISAAYITACAYWLLYLYHPNIYSIICVLTLNSIAQLTVLPSISYLADSWFPLQQRFIVYGVGLYINLLGYGLAGTVSTFLSYPKNNVTVDSIVLSFAIVGTISFLLSIFTLKNEPKRRMEKKKRVNFFQHLKALYEKSYQSYLIIIVGIFLAVDWAFLTQLGELQPSFQEENPFAATVFNISWIVFGGASGLLLSYFVQKKITKSGKYRDYDFACKVILVIGFVGCAILGILNQFNLEQYLLDQFLVVLVGAGHVGFYGLAFLSLVESLYPIPNLLISTLIELFASAHSIIIVAVSANFPKINPFLTMTAITLFPLIFYFLVAETNFQRYELYFNEKSAKFQLLKVQDWVTQTSK